MILISVSQNYKMKRDFSSKKKKKKERTFYYRELTFSKACLTQFLRKLSETEQKKSYYLVSNNARL